MTAGVGSHSWIGGTRYRWEHNTAGRLALVADPDPDLPRMPYLTWPPRRFTDAILDAALARGRANA